MTKDNNLEDLRIHGMVQLLDERKKTCILLNGSTVIFEAEGLGVKPLRQLRQSAIKKHPGDYFILIDRVIGKGALMLSELIGADEIYTPLTSQCALDYSKRCGIPIHALSVVPFIENRDRTGMCPIENSVQHTDDPAQGECNIEDAIHWLMNAKPQT